jgi:spermidine/putrescine-binding protein
MKNIIVRIAACAFALAMLLSFSGCIKAEADNKNSINFYNWGQYISDGTRRI